MWRLLFFSVFRAAAFHGLMLACMYPEMMDGRVKTLHPRVCMSAFLFVFVSVRIPFLFTILSGSWLIVGHPFFSCTR